MAKKPTVTTLQSGFNSTEVLNENFENIRDAFDNTLSLDGSTPNAMQADLDLNGNNLIGATGLLINGTDYLADVEAAKAAALVAQAAAELAENNAETAKVNAEVSETAAGLSATAAATSATASAASAVDATNNGAAQVSLAAAQVTLAETAKTGAELAETNAETSEINAATSATNAATSETNASTSASTASTKASEAATSATNAATSATEAETAKTGAETARDAALAALDSFDDRYLGVKASDPTVDNDGDALVVGAIYFNSNTDLLYVYNGTTWQVTANAASGDLVSTNNLSDLTSPATARTNLGLGTGDTPTFAGINTTGNATFGDNDKAIFGAGSDLQIYCDGTHSYVDEVGSGTLLIRTNGTSMRLYDTANSADMIRAYTGGSVRIFNDGSQKFATTSTGIDVNGTVTADGLTVDGNGTVNGQLEIASTAPHFKLTDTDVTGFSRILGNSGNIYLDADPTNENPNSQVYIRTDGKNTALFDDTGDIIFYEDTGTTPKFYWDASAESLGIGTSSPEEKLHVEGSIKVDFGSAGGNPRVYLDHDSATDDGNYLQLNRGDDGLEVVGQDNVKIRTNNSEAMRIDSSGNVGIGTSSPATELDVDGTVTATSFEGDGSSLTGIAAGAGGGGNDEIFWENGQNVTTNYTITNGKNAMSAGPITINSGVTVTVGAGETWTVV